MRPEPRSIRRAQLAFYLAIAISLPLLAFGAVSPAAETRDLYLVTGFETFNGINESDVRIDSAVFVIDEKRSTLTGVADLTDPGTGSDLIIADQDRRLVVVVGYQPGKERTAILDMDRPDNPRTLTLPSDRETWMNYRFTHPSVWMPVDHYRWTYLFPENGRFVRRESQFSATGAQFSKSVDVIQMPPDLNPAGDEKFFLLVNNDDMVVIGKGKNNPTDVQSVSLVFDRVSAKWHEVTIPNAGMTMRGFGPWIATQKAGRKTQSGTTPENRDKEPQSPGKEFRQTMIWATGRVEFRVEELFAQSDFYFPGELYLYNVHSREKHAIQTGQGDSEILLVDGGKVYYRVNDTIYNATIGKSGVEAPKKILTNARVPLVHWAFLGPSLQRE